MQQWRDLIDSALVGSYTEPIRNLDEAAGTHYDAIFVGGGAAGRFGAAIMRGLGGRPLIIDRWPFLGGSCPHQACVPHHLFSEVARELDLAKTLEGRLWFGPFDPKSASVLAVVELFRSERSLAHAHMNWQSERQLEIEYLLNAQATVLDARTVSAAGTRFTTDALILGTGSRTRWPGISGENLPGVYDYASMVDELDHEPQRIVVIGGSKVAVEYGSFLHATGKPTSVVSRSAILTTGGPATMDEDLRAFVVDGMRVRGMDLREHSEVTRIVGDGRVEGVYIRDADGTEELLEADFVLMATGEQPNVESFEGALDLERTTEGFVRIDARMRTSVPGVYAVGDLTGPPHEMFKARKGGMAAARAIMGVDYELDVADYPDFLHTTYEVTWAGLGESAARARYGDVVCIQVPPKGMDPGDTSLPMAEGSMLLGFTERARSGFQKCVIDAITRRVVGIHHAGYGAKDAFQYLHHLMTRPGGLTVDELGEMNELFLNPETFIQYGRLRASRSTLLGM
jgi:dihydrolipoamide dehydrogenase